MNKQSIPQTKNAKQFAGWLLVLLGISLSCSAQNASINIYNSTVKLTGATVGLNSGDVNIQSGGKIDNSGTIQLAGNWVNNGILTSQAGSFVIFNGSSNCTFSGSSVSSFNTLQINKGSGTATILDMNGSGSANATILTLTNGLVRINSTATLSYVGALAIPSTAGIAVNGGTYTETSGGITNSGSFSVSSGSANVGTGGGIGGSFANSSGTAGTFTVSGGTANIGSIAGNALTNATGNTISISGGTVNIAGRLASTSGNINISGGTISLCTVGNTSGITGSFDMSATSVVSVTGNPTIIFQNPSILGTAYDLNLTTGSGAKTFSSASVFQFGNPFTPGSSTFRVNANGLTLGSVLVNSTNNPAVQLVSNATLSGQLTLASTGNLDLNGNTMTLGGGGNLGLGGAGARAITSSITPGYLTITTSTTTVNNGGSLTFQSPVTVILANGFNCGTGNLTTVNGILQINSGGFIQTNAPKYASGSLLKYNSGGTYGRSIEWSGFGTIGITPGYPYNVQISSGTTVDPGGASFMGTALDLSHDLTIDAGTALYMDYSGHNMTVPLVIGNNLNINGSLSESQTFGGDINIGGNWTDAGNFYPNSRAVFFQGTSNQTISRTGGGTENFSYIRINKPAGTSLKIDNTAGSQTDVGVNATSSDVFKIMNKGVLDLNGRTFNITGGSSPSYSGDIYVSGARTVTNSQGIGIGRFLISAIPAPIYIPVVDSLNIGTLTFDSTVLVDLVSGFDAGINHLTYINGTLQIGSGGFVQTNAPWYGTNSLLQYYSGNSVSSAYKRGNEWNAGPGNAGYPYNVQISNSTWLDPSGGNSFNAVTLSLKNNLTIDASSAIYMNYSGFNMTIPLIAGNNVTINGSLSLSGAVGGDFQLGGNWTDHGSFFPNSRDVAFNGSSAETLAKTNSPFSETFDYLDINNATGVTLNATPITITTQLRLLKGIVFAGSNLVSVTNNASSAVFDYDSIPSLSAYYSTSTSSWINGTLKRSAQVNGTYYFPIGTSSYYELLRLAPIAGSGLTDLTTSFTNPSCNTISIQIAANLPYINSTQVNTGLDYGYWTVSPNGGYTSPKYNLALYETGYNNCGSFQPAIKDSAYGIVKRTNSSSPWTGTFFGSIGYHHNSLQQQYNPSGALWCFKAIRDSIPSFSDYAIGYNGQDIALPLQLVSFDAQYENNLVHLNWVTESELNTDHFEIERSEDGSQFENIGKVEAAHRSTTTLNYNFDDVAATSLHVSPLYYRLRMVDEDSSATYSMIRSVQLPYPSSLQIQLNPNPFSDHVNIVVVSPKVQQAQLTMYDEQGVVVMASQDVSLNAGKNDFEFSAADHLPAAVYFLRISTDASSVTMKLVKE